MAFFFSDPSTKFLDFRRCHDASLRPKLFIDNMRAVKLLGIFSFIDACMCHWIWPLGWGWFRGPSERVRGCATPSSLRPRGPSYTAKGHPKEWLQESVFAGAAGQGSKVIVIKWFFFVGFFSNGSSVFVGYLIVIARRSKTKYQQGAKQLVAFFDKFCVIIITNCFDQRTSFFAKKMYGFISI